LKLFTENCGQTLQMETCLLLTAYKKSSAPYPIILSPTPLWLTV